MYDFFLCQRIIRAHQHLLPLSFFQTHKLIFSHINRLQKQCNIHQTTIHLLFQYICCSRHQIKRHVRIFLAEGFDQICQNIHRPCLSASDCHMSVDQCFLLCQFFFCLINQPDNFFCPAAQQDPRICQPDSPSSPFKQDYPQFFFHLGQLTA